MNCRRTEELIPLYVGGDLDKNATEAVRDHLASCNDCAMLASQFDESRRWLDGATPRFEEALFDDIKRGVMREIGTLEPRRGVRDWLMRSVVPLFGSRPLVVAATALLALAAGILFLLYSSRSGLTKPDEQRAREEQPAPQTPDVASANDERDRDNPAPHPRHHRRHIHIRHDVETPTEVAVRKNSGNDIREASTEPEGGDDQMLRIEILTSDPNVRIIWFAPKEIDSQTRPVTDFE
jgi:anti-sigma factor RsiW